MAHTDKQHQIKVNDGVWASICGLAHLFKHMIAQIVWISTSEHNRPLRSYIFQMQIRIRLFGSFLPAKLAHAPVPKTDGN